jgi:hypothetical protein
MGGQYLVYLYPLLAILCTQLMLAAHEKFRLFILSWFLCGSVFVIVSAIRNQAHYTSLVESVQQAELIVVSNLDRRAFPRLIPYLHNGQEVLMDEQASLSNDSLLKAGSIKSPFLLISGKEEALKGKTAYQVFDANDGVIFFTATISAQPFSAPFPAK